MSAAAIGNHLWQSTIFAAIVWLATAAFRRNRAAARYALWCAASIKFLIPFAAIVVVGQQFGLRAPAPIVRREMTIVVQAVSHPFNGSVLISSTPAPAGFWTSAANIAPSVLAALWGLGFVIVVAAWSARWRRVAAIARAAAPLREGRTVDMLRRIEATGGVTRRISIVASDAPLEPGVFGIVRPVLVWPTTIAGHLDDEQIATVLTHEVAHVRRHDNGTAAMHMIVEALFWFHPLVWWIGARLVDERERACDEDVLHAGRAPEVYAETILKACRAFVESPLPCVAGITGSELKTRIERIMEHRDAQRLTAWQKVLLAALVAAPIAAPMTVGAVSTPRPAVVPRNDVFTYRVRGAGQDPATFEVAAVKPNRSGDAKVTIQILPGGRFSAIGVTLRQLIRNAYQLQEFQITSGPAWIDTDRFDIVAKTEGVDTTDPFQAGTRGPGPVQLMLRGLLADRFKLEVHTDSKQLPIYALARSRSGAFGPALQRSNHACLAGRVSVGPPAGAVPPAEPPLCGMRVLPGTIVAGGVSLAQLANTLSGLVNRVVVDRTGVADNFEFTLRWTPEQIPAGFDKKAAAMGLPPIDADGPSLFTAMREQLGLKVDAQKGPVDILIVDRAERPHEN